MGYQAVERGDAALKAENVSNTQKLDLAPTLRVRQTDMNRISRAFIVALPLAVLGIGSAAAQNPSIPIGKNGDVELTQTSALGTTVLKPGHYRLKHAVLDGQHFLVVRRQQVRMLSGGQHFATGGRTEVARVACQLVPLGAIAKDTELHTRTQPDGFHVITQIRIRGEGAGHIVALEPKG